MYDNKIPLNNEIKNKQTNLTQDILISQESNLIIVNARIGNYDNNYKTIIDSGSSFNFINESILKDVSIPMGNEQFKVNSVSGSPLIFDTYVYFSISIGGIKFPETKFIVYNDTANQSLPKADILLGFNFISNNKLIINVPNKKISIRDNLNNMIDIYCQESKPITFYRNIICYAAESISINDQTQTKVPITFNNQISNNNDLFFFEPKVKTKYLNNLDIMEGLMNIDDNAFILVNSNSDKQVKINKGEKLGTIKQVIETNQNNNNDNNTVPIIEQLNKINFPNLNKQQKDKVKTILNSNSSVFSTGNNDVGFIKDSEMIIEVLDDTPIYQKPRRFPQPINEKIDQQVKELIQMDIVEESKSPWSSPVVPITKKSGEIRLCIDYRKINKVIKNNPFPFPSLLDSVHNLSNMQYFTCLDMTKGYYQLNVSKKSRPYLGFSTHRGHYQFKRCSFGLKTAPAAFQKEIQKILQKFSWKQVVVFLDDICIMSSTFEEHLELLNNVLSTLSEAGIKLNLDKCKWARDKVDFLGHEVSASGLRKSKKYIDCVKSLQRPITVTDLRHFLGIINFQRKFIPNCSTIQKCLSEKTGGDGKKRLEWTNEMEEAFEQLKIEAAKEVELAYPCYKEGSPPLEIYVDASQTGAGAMLKQNNRPIAYASMTFNKAQRNYSTLEREIAALRFGITNMKPFLLGTKFICYTDHQPIVYMNKMKMANSRLARTFQELSEYDFIIKYIPGKLNAAADALSRLPADIKTNEQNVEENAEMPEFVTKTIPGGPDSMFAAIHQCFKVAKIPCPSPEQLRLVAIEEILQHPSEYSCKLNKEKTRELKSMKTPGITPCMEALLALSKIYNVCIYMYGHTHFPLIFDHTKPNTEVTTVYLQCLGGIHFNALIKCEDKTDKQVYYIKPYKKQLASKKIKTENNNANINNLNSCDIHKAKLKSTLTINNVKFCFIIDTGAEASLCSQEVINYLKLDNKINKTNRYIKGLNNEKTTITGKINLEFSFNNQGKLFQNDFLIMNTSSIGFCILLGTDFLNNNKLILDFGNKTIYNIEDTSVKPILCLTSSVVSNHTVASATHYMQQEKPLPSLTANKNIEEEEKLKNPELQHLMQKVKINQYMSPVLKAVIQQVKNKSSRKNWPEITKSFAKYSNNLTINKEDILCYTKDNKPVFVISYGYCFKYIKELHNETSHISRDKLIHATKNKIWHPGMEKIIEIVCKTCRSCQQYKPKSKYANAKRPMLKISTSSPFELVSVDVLAMPTSKGYCGILVAIDHHSKWLSAVPIRNKTTNEICDKLFNAIIPSFSGKVRNILSDNGREFASMEFEQHCSNLSIRHIFTTPYSPSSNGSVERANRTIIGFLRSRCDDATKWPIQLPKVVIDYNHTKHSGLPCTPSEYLLQYAHKEFSNLKPVSSKWKEEGRKFTPYKLYDKVWKKIETKGNLLNNKLAPKYNGPFTIIKVNPNMITYKIKSKEGKVINAHMDQLEKVINIPMECKEKIKEEPWYKNDIDPYSSSEDTMSHSSNVTSISSTSCTELSSEDEDQQIPCRSTPIPKKKHVQIEPPSLTHQRSQPKRYMSNRIFSTSFLRNQQSVSHSLNELDFPSSDKTITYNFSGFPDKQINAIQQLTNSIEDLQEMLEETEDKRSLSVIGRSLIEICHRVRDSIMGTFANKKIAPPTAPVEKRHTRSKGPVEPQPHVMPKPLERK